MANLIKGIDVSIIQGNIDWQAVVASGIQFCIMRCGVGNGGIDSNYAKNVAGAKAAGIKVACYHFIYPLPTIPSQPLRDPIKQAQYHFNASLGELTCVDCEWPAPQDWSKWGCNSAQLNQWMLTYLQEYERLSGRKPLIYTYPNWADNVGFQAAFSQYPLWIASYQANPDIPHPWSDWVLWQNTGGGGHLPTTGAPVDTDLAKDLSLWDTTAAPTNEPIPDHQPDPPINSNPVPAPITPPPAVTPTSPPVIMVPPTTNTVSKDFNIVMGLFRALLNLFKEELPKL